MNRQVHTLSTRPVTETHAHYKVTRTFVGADGKKRTETVEMLDDDAIKQMRSFQRRPDQPQDGNRFEFRPVPNSGDDAHPSSRAAPPREAKRATAAQDNREFVHEALQVHNELRRKHGVEALRLNSDLSKLAQQWANHLASTEALVHSKTKYHNQNVGENLRCQSWPITGKDMTESWYNECKKYDYQNRQAYQSGTGHFTQVVWKNTQEVGFAQAQGPSMHFAVAMYYPAGNFLGEFDKNVHAPR